MRLSCKVLVAQYWLADQARGPEQKPARSANNRCFSFRPNPVLCRLPTPPAAACRPPPTTRCTTPPHHHALSGRRKNHFSGSNYAAIPCSAAKPRLRFPPGFVVPVAGHIRTACADHLALSLRRLRAALAPLTRAALHVASALQELLQTDFSFRCNCLPTTLTKMTRFFLCEGK